MRKIIDLTLTLKDSMRGVSVEPKMTMAADGWNASTYHLYSHAGTHMDAPTHYDVNDTSIDRIPLERCIGEAWIVDCGSVRAKELLTPGHLGDSAAKISSGDFVLIRTGWSRNANEPCYRDELPRVGAELAEWFAERRISLLGVEPPAVADVHNFDEIQSIHNILLEADIIIVEGLANLDKITSDRVEFMALPLKVAGGDGAPVRAIAIEDSNENP
jgi:arylformamidase